MRVKTPHVPATVQLLWQEKACHLLDTDEAKSGSLFLVFWPEGGDESEDSLSLRHSQVA